MNGNKLIGIFKTKEGSIFVGLTFLCIILSIFTSTFLTVYNIGIVIRQVSFIAIVAIGQTLVLLTGGIDLSVGAIAGLSSILGSMMMSNMGISPLISVPVAIIFGMMFGLVNGLLIAKMKLNAFIVTLAIGEVLSGLILVITRGYPVLNLPKSFTIIGQGMVGPVPIPVIFMIVVVLIMNFILNSTPFGRNVYATGGSRIASVLAGIRVDSVILRVYMLSGLFAGLSGILMTSRMNAGQPTIGATWVMPSVTAAIIGGTSLAGGEGTVWGTLIGAIFMGILSNGIVLLNISSYWERVIIGIVVIFAVGIDFLRSRTR
ncbi:MAG: ABC transporter permease [Sphaerochaetaceae bacterium]|jgi:ribose transport system permease protein|nr:ABC transporter permease [Sphaerochaetaceae bacterium]